ncbi:hypothetical protein KUCAC02_017329 [Chaenocephalus aceratus]|uniref:Uncharacterized protein n=1 Tax=Chaenocephalus aceratus TaxID=36190 RepID=A0ACB9W1H8_CHAAC|nr:hypothetical protein KUCAC02_017329 [Chaenocephalus aceratus]
MSSDSNTAGGIQGLLLKLHESLSDEDPRAAALKCHDIVGDLAQDCMLTTDNELALQTPCHQMSSGTPEVKGWEKTYAIDIRNTCMVLQTTKASSVVADLRICEIFNRYYSELCQKSKLADSVLAKSMSCWEFSQRFIPARWSTTPDKLYKAYLGELKEQMTSLTKEPKLYVVAGCLRGITALMVKLPQNYGEDPATSKDIFQYAMKAISPQVEMKPLCCHICRAQINRQTCIPVQQLPDGQLQSFVRGDVQACGHINAEMKKTSYYALEAFLKQVAILELSIAIRGYGFFAGPCKKVCPQDVDLMYTELIQRSSVLIHLDKVPEVYTPLLERLMVVQIDNFPQYSEKMQSVCCRSILKVLVAMASKGPVLWSFISSVVHQGLIRVCSKPIMLSEDKDGGQSQSSQMRTGKWKVPSSQNYLALFKNLLDCDGLKDLRIFGWRFLKKVATGEEAPDDAAHLLPNKIKDFTAFINLVDFCSELLLTKHVEYFDSWMYPLSHELILHSIWNPLVSGFYKLLSVTMKIGKRIKYYQGVGTRSSSSPQSDAQYKDELLASCLTFVLSLHHNIVALDIKAYCPALEAALKLGLSHVPLANTALDALEDWSSYIPLETMQHCYSSILPLLDGYLKSTSTNNKDESNWEVMSSLSSKSEKGYKRVLTRLMKKSNQLNMEDAPLDM